MICGKYNKNKPTGDCLSLKVMRIIFILIVIIVIRRLSNPPERGVIVVIVIVLGIRIFFKLFLWIISP